MRPIESEGYRPAEDAAATEAQKEFRRGLSSRDTLRSHFSKRLVISPITGEEVELSQLLPEEGKTSK
jgi:hypothetical protein